jgi:hypothetical protein
MASLIARRAFTTTARRLAKSGDEALKEESKRNPELIVRKHFPEAEDYRCRAISRRTRYTVVTRWLIRGYCRFWEASWSLPLPAPVTTSV